MGHLARCTALACALREEGFELETTGLGASAPIEVDGVPWSPEGSTATAGAGVDLLVLDTYDRDDWRRLAAQPHGRLVAFADALPDPVAADVVIAPEDGIERSQKVLSGLRFACLRRDFWEVGPRDIRERPQCVVVTAGGSDLGGLAARLATRLSERLPAVCIELVRGPGFAGEPPPGVTVLDRPSSLLEPLLRADAVVCAGGQTMLEAAATGTPALAIEAAPNQRRQIISLAARDAVLPVGENETPQALERLLGSASVRRNLSRHAQEAVDGRGALRVAAVLAKECAPRKKRSR